VPVGVRRQDDVPRAHERFAQRLVAAVGVRDEDLRLVGRRGVQPEHARGRSAHVIRRQQQGADLPVHAVVDGDPLDAIAGAPLDRDAPDALGGRPGRQVAERAPDDPEHVRTLAFPGGAVGGQRQLRYPERPVGSRYGPVTRRLVRRVGGSRRRAGGGSPERLVLADREVAQEAIGDGLPEVPIALGRAVRPILAEQALDVVWLEQRVQVVHGHAEGQHRLDGDRVVAADIGGGAREAGPAPGVPVVQDRRGRGEDERRRRRRPQPADDLPQVRAIVLGRYLVAALGQLEVVQAAVAVDEVRPRRRHPLLQVTQHVGAVAAVRRRTHHLHPAGQPLGDGGSVPQADGVPNQQHDR